MVGWSVVVFILVPVSARACVKHKQLLSPEHSLGPVEDMYCKAILALVINITIVNVSPLSA